MFDMFDRIEISFKVAIKNFVQIAGAHVDENRLKTSAEKRLLPSPVQILSGGCYVRKKGS